MAPTSHTPLPPLRTWLDPDAAMQLALSQATLAHPVCRPNPGVGCVLLNPQGGLIGYGHTQAPGQAHAEVMALWHAQSHGLDTQGATAYVTLEPCAHQGRTGPCCVALVRAGIAKVVASLGDPNPKVAGQGFAHLQAHGVTVEVGAGQDEALAQNLGFFSSVVRKRPWVRLKMAASLDGFTALLNGQSQWITTAAARADTQRWRAQADAIVTGIGTVLADDPLLNCRPTDADDATSDAPPALLRQPMLVIADGSLRTPATARLWQVPQRAVRLFHSDATQLAENPLLHRTMAAHPHAQAIALPPQGVDHTARVDEGSPSRPLNLESMLQYLNQENIQYVHVEAGSSLSSSMLAAGLVDEILLYMAPKLLGQGRALFPHLLGTSPLEDLSQAPTWRFVDVATVGDDIRVRLQHPSNQQWLAQLA